MRPQLVAEIRRRGVICRRDALRLVPDYVLDDAITDGAIRRIFPEVYALPDRAKDRGVRRHGAVAHRPRTALSAIDALDVWGVFPFAIPAVEPIHVTGDLREPSSNWPGLKVHRRAAFVRRAPHAWEVRDLPAVRIEQAIIDSWTMLPEVDHRVPVITAVRERRTTGLLLREVLANNSRAAGLAEMRHVFDLVAAGCHSPLELWGHENVFSDASLPLSKCQVPMKLSTGSIYLDRYYEEERLNVELDGAAYHGEPGQRERDIRRDAELATLGIQAVRFSHPRLFGDPDGVRSEVLRILRVRRQQFGLSA
jgi:very-short-patch-repair endonuclease